MAHEDGELSGFDISSFEIRYAGYPTIVDRLGSYEDPNLDDMYYDKDDTYNKDLTPQNKRKDIDLPKELTTSICLGRVLNPGLTDYYLVEVLDGDPHPMILVHPDDLIIKWTVENREKAVEEN